MTVTVNTGCWQEATDGGFTVNISIISASYVKMFTTDANYSFRGVILAAII